VHPSDDKSVPVENSIRFYHAFLNHNVKTGVRIYQNGGHGFGLQNTITPDSWFDRVAAWMQANKMIAGK
jgi:dipeptidyl aminopeptidase/acylaminoacyl peptidase